VSILSKRVGVTTAQIFDAAPGDRVWCLGPLGRPFTLADPPAEVWMVAGGVGLAPFWTVAEALAARKVPMTLFYGGRRDADLFYLDVFERLGVGLALSTEDGSRGEHGRVTTPLERALAARAGRDVRIQACGPEPMLEAVARLAARSGCPCEVSVERVMGCGLGGCYSCVVPVKAAHGGSHHVRSCIGGPVFDAAALVWD
jgi:dihydroorotate dehydrogenase electron transfer subunit